MSITSLPINEFHEIRRIIELYKKRWQVEVLFKTLKSGMRIEKLKYESLSALQNNCRRCTSRVPSRRARKWAQRRAGLLQEYAPAAEWKALYMVRKRRS
ncbi:MAG: transposase [Pirellulales bacterium]